MPNPTTPPKTLTRLIERLCAPHLREEVLGDLHERYARRVQQWGVAKARHRYWLEVLAYVRLSVIKRQSHQYPSPDGRTPFFLSPDMFRNYLTVAFRNLVKNKSFNAINVLGLTLGMTCCLFIFLWIMDEERVDNFHANGKTLYTLYQTVTTNGKATGTYSTPIRAVARGRTSFLVDGLKDVIPGVSQQAFYATGYELPWGHPETFQVGDRKFKLEGSRASNDFFTMFSYPILAGNAATALRDISSIAISRKMADLFFGSPQKAMGKALRYENKLDFVVTAVFEDIPLQNSLKFDFLLSWEAQIKKLEWSSNDFRTYIQLDDQADADQVAAKINRFLQPRLAPKERAQIRIGLQRYGDQYLHDQFVNGKPEDGRIEYVRLFSGVAVFLLLIACVNFMNLATARSVKRAKEIGVRKVIGSSRLDLIGQFLGESLLLSCLAIILALGLMQVLLPGFNQFTGKQIASPITQASFWTYVLGLLVVTGLLAGSYPAFFLSSLRPVRVLKGVVRFTQSTIRFRQGLTVFQFVLSITLLIATLVISKQISYVRHTHLGYDRENLLYLRIEGALMTRSNYLFFKEQLSKKPGIAMVDRSSEAPHSMGFLVDDYDGYSETGTDDDAIKWEGKEKGQSVAFHPTSVGIDFLNLMQLKLAEGRGFSRTIATDSTDAFLINEEAVKQMGLKNPLGKWVSAWQKKGHIIGVLKDYHTNSLHESIKPLIVDVKENEYFGVILIRTRAGQTKQALASIEDVYRSINPAYPFSYQFLDQEYDQLYRSEEVLAKLSNVFAILAILISCLGLLGLVMFSIEQRIKEIGIRKVLGSSERQIVLLISENFLKLILVAFFIAGPLAWFAMSQWLQGFAYRITITWWMFALAGGSVIVVTLLTISFQTIRAALMNPIQSLRSE